MNVTPPVHTVILSGINRLVVCDPKHSRTSCPLNVTLCTTLHPLRHPPAPNKPSFGCNDTFQQISENKYFKMRTQIFILHAYTISNVWDVVSHSASSPSATATK